MNLRPPGCVYPFEMGQLVFDSETWMVAAACLGHNQLFFAPDESESRSQRAYRESRAKAVCHECVVRTHCLSEALRSDERFGIWGGLTEKERRALRRSPDGADGHLAVTPPDRGLVRLAVAGRGPGVRPSEI